MRGLLATLDAPAARFNPLARRASANRARGIARNQAVQGQRCLTATPIPCIFRSLSDASYGIQEELALANIASARKRARQAVKNRAHNMALRSRFRTSVKGVIKAIRAGDQEGATVAYRKAVPVIDSTVGKGLIHRNKAARHKSRLNARIREMAQA
jgi:small subunit ribosomal protein S20